MLLPVVLGYQLAPDILLNFDQVLVARGQYLFGLEAPKQPFHCSIVPALTKLTHALCQSITPESLAEITTGILASLIRLLKNDLLWPTALFPGFIRSFCS